MTQHRVERVTDVDPPHEAIRVRRKRRLHRAKLATQQEEIEPSISISAVCVCVGYDDLLKITLPTVLPHVQQFVVVTSPEDARTQSYVADFPKVRVCVTDVFTRDGAKFNKGAGMEAGFDSLGREGWILVLDADMLMPPDLSAQIERLDPQVGNLYTPRRRILDDPKDWSQYATPENWQRLPLRQDEKGFYGYFQLFHASDPVLAGSRHWYPVDVTHAGVCDNEFQLRWPQEKKIRPTFEVLHLGRCDANWFGRTTERLDGGEIDGNVEESRQMLTRLHKKYGWNGQKRNRRERIDERIRRTPRRKG